MFQFNAYVAFHKKRCLLQQDLWMEDDAHNVRFHWQQPKSIKIYVKIKDKD